MDDPRRQLEEELARMRMGSMAGGGGMPSISDLQSSNPQRSTPSFVNQYEFHKNLPISAYGSGLGNPDYEDATNVHQRIVASPPSDTERKLAGIYAGIRPSVGYSAPTGFSA